MARGRSLLVAAAAAVGLLGAPYLVLAGAGQLAIVTLLANFAATVLASTVLVHDAVFEARSWVDRALLLAASSYGVYLAALLIVLVTYAYAASISSLLLAVQSMMNSLKVVTLALELLAVAGCIGALARGWSYAAAPLGALVAFIALALTPGIPVFAVSLAELSSKKRSGTRVGPV